MQLSYRESLQEGASVRVLFPDTEAGSIDLPVARCVQAAVKLLRPNQESSDNDLVHYKQQAWNILQVHNMYVGGWIVLYMYMYVCILLIWGKQFVFGFKIWYGLPP